MKILRARPRPPRPRDVRATKLRVLDAVPIAPTSADHSIAPCLIYGPDGALIATMTAHDRVRRAP